MIAEFMATNLYIAFVGISIGVIVFPGPSILLIIANSLQQGVRSGLYTVAGGWVAMLLQVTVALIGLTSLANFLERGFDMVRWVGIGYLMYLGVQRWRSGASGSPSLKHERNNRSAMVTGFLVALTNPGTMLFFIAFFPQFLNTAAAPGPQLLLMAFTFMVLTLIFDTTYALLSARIGQALQDPRQVRIRNRVSGAILLFAAVALALVNF